MSLRRRLHDLTRWAQVGGRLSSYLRRRSAGFAAAIGLSLVFALIRLLEPWPLQIVLDQVVLGKSSQLPIGLDPMAWVGGDPLRLLGLAAVLVVLLALASGAIYYVQSVLVARIALEVIRDIREDVFHHLLRLSLAFHRRNDPGDLLMRLTGDMIFLREMILASVVTLTGETLILLTTLVLMFLVSPKLTLVTLLVAPGFWLLFRFFRGRMRDVARKQRKREGRIARQIGESLLAIPMIQSFTAEEAEDERFRKICKKSERAGLRAARLEAGMQRLVEILVALGTCLVLWFGIREVLAGDLTPGVFLVFLAYLRAAFKPVRKLAKVAERTARATAAAERILEVLDQRRDVKSSKKANPAPALQGHIVFEDVGFTYEDGTEALHSISGEILPGQQIAVAGKSGAGKSTLFSLLLGFSRPTEGRVLLDGVSMKRFTLQSVRRQIAYLPQEPFLVAGTIRENLLFGDPEAKDDELWDALASAELDDFVRGLPRGLETRVSSRGQSLSGGQKQRLAIARALLKNAPILLLDEPATGLDPETEDALMRSLERLRHGRTTLVIAHRPETFRSAQRVWVLKDGRLVSNTSPETSGIATDASAAKSSAPQRELPPPLGLQEDDDVKGVARWFAPGGGRSFLREFRSVTGIETEVGVRSVKQRLGQRALVHVSGAGRGWFVKLQRQRISGHVERAQEREEAARLAGFEVARTVGGIEKFRALVQEERTEPMLWSVSEDAKVRCIERLGAALAHFHGMDLPAAVEPVQGEEVRLERARARAAERAGATWALLDGAWRTCLDELLTAVPRLSPFVPIHGDLHPEQLLVGSNDKPVLLDWDLCGAGPVARDVGNLLGHFHLEALRERISEDQRQRYSSLFCGGYRGVAPDRLDEDAVIWHTASTLLRLCALHADPGFGACPPNSEELPRALLERAESVLRGAFVASVRTPERFV